MVLLTAKHIFTDPESFIPIFVRVSMTLVLFFDL
jgi:hypothetical protein